MKKSLYLSLLLLGGIVSANSIITMAKVEPAALVSFDQAFVTGNSLVTATKSFETAKVEFDMDLSTKFEVSKNLYVQTNTTTPLTISLHSLGDANGKLTHTNGIDDIRVDYKLMDDDYATFDGTLEKTLTSSPRDGTGDSVGTFWFKQHYDTPGDQVAGKYSITFEVILKAS